MQEYIDLTAPATPILDETPQIVRKYVRCTRCRFDWVECAALGPCPKCGRGGPGRRAPCCPICQSTTFVIIGGAE